MENEPMDNTTFLVQCDHGPQAGNGWRTVSYNPDVATARLSMAAVIGRHLDRKDRGEESEENWRKLIKAAATANPGDVLCFDEFAVRIVEEMEVDPNSRVECRIILNVVENNLESLRDRLGEVVGELSAKIMEDDCCMVSLAKGEPINTISIDRRHCPDGAEVSAALTVRKVDGGYSFIR